MIGIGTDFANLSGERSYSLSYYTKGALISARTVRAAKRNLDGRITSKRIGAAWYHALKK